MKEEKLTDEQIDNLGKIIPYEMYFAITLLMATDMLIVDVERRLKQISKTMMIGKEFKQRLNIYKSKINECRNYYDGLIEPSIIRSGRGNNYQNYEDTRILTNELIRILLLSYEKTKDKESSDKLFDFLQSLPNNRGIFSVDDINKFTIR